MKANRYPVTPLKLKKRPRKEVSVAVEDRLREFYNGRFCVTSHEQRSKFKGNATWHHLDGDASNSTFENIIPLDAQKNCITIEQFGRNQSVGLVGLYPNLLQVCAEEHYRIGNRSCAYGCWRLGAFLFSIMEADADFALECATNALECLIPYKDPTLATDILARNVLPILDELPSMLGSSWRTAMAKVACDISDYQKLGGLYEDSRRFAELAERLVRDIPDSEIKARILRARLAYHTSGICGSTGNLGRAQWLLDKATEALKTTGNTFGRPANGVQQVTYKLSTPREAAAILDTVTAELGAGHVESNLGKRFLDENVSLEPWVHVCEAEIRFVKGCVESDWLPFVKKGYEAIKQLRMSQCWAGYHWLVIDEFENKHLQFEDHILWRCPADLNAFSGVANEVGKRLANCI